MKKLTCSVGICVYNEEQNIEHLLDSLFSQKMTGVRIGEIIIVASGTTDRTIQLVTKYMRRHRTITLIRERKRQGKASAVNKFIAASSHDILLLVGGDLLLSPRVVQELVGKFHKNNVGMTGARPTPVNRENGLAIKSARLLWDLHHRISMEHPKMGEVIAFRKIFKRIPLLSSVDEANIEPLIRGQGYEILYVPKAVVHNKAPTTISDFIKQRRRIYNGHTAVKNEQSYEVSTYRLGSIVRAIFGVIHDDPRIGTIGVIVITAFLEGTSRLLGWWDYYISKKQYTVWDVVTTTKNPTV